MLCSASLPVVIQHVTIFDISRESEVTGKDRQRNRQLVPINVSLEKTS